MLVGEVVLATAFQEKIVESLFTEFADKGGADEAVVAGDEDF